MTTEPRRFTTFATLDAVTLARRLLGQRLVHVTEGVATGGTIVETEAYLGVEDRAAHSYGGRRTARTETMYREGGHAYVYFIYGMHWCFNVVAGPAETPTAVLIRALIPDVGAAAIRERRPRARRDRDLCSGPARLTQALRIDGSCDGVDLRDSACLYIERRRQRSLPASRIVAAPRVGVSYAGAWAARPYRFLVRDCEHVSVPPPVSNGRG